MGCVPVAFQGIDFGLKKRHEFDLLRHCIVLQLVFHRDMTCLCHKNPLGFQCHISQQLVGNNVCPNCCSKSPTTASEKKKKNYYSTLKLPQLLNFVYFKVEAKVKRVQKLVNCKSKQHCSTCGTNDLPSVQVFASYESPSSSAAAKLSRSQRTRSVGPHPWRRCVRLEGWPPMTLLPMLSASETAASYL